MADYLAEGNGDGHVGERRDFAVVAEAKVVELETVHRLERDGSIVGLMCRVHRSHFLELVDIRRAIEQVLV